MEYISTRGGSQPVTAAGAIIKGLAPDGGLFVPAEINTIDIAALQGKDYYDIAYAVLQGFLPQYSEEFLRGAIAASYRQPFGGRAGQLQRLDGDLYALELWHGPTAAFKDYALQLLPKLLVEAKKLEGESDETLILVATSGDTGTAALSGFCDVENTSIACFYPQDGTSEVQKLQMTTQTGSNVAVYAVEGNFDDAQRGVKAAFSDAAMVKELAGKGVKLSSANSINWGRLLPQIVYYVSSYLALCEQGCIQFGDEVDYCVPTGNFGDIMAGYYAKALGLPVGRLVCAANRNNVLADFLETGHYNAKREFFKTSSPSMDILVSSNLERLLYHESGSAEKVAEWMRALATEGEYTVDADVMDSIRETFAAGWVGEIAVAKQIADIHETYGYLCDPHTAVAFTVARKKRQGRPVVVLSTASPFKFSGKVLASLGRPVPHDEFDALHDLERVSGVKAPETLASLDQKPVRFEEVIAAAEIPQIPLRLKG